MPINQQEEAVVLSKTVQGHILALITSKGGSRCILKLISAAPLAS